METLKIYVLKYFLILNMRDRFVMETKNAKIWHLYAKVN